MLFTRTPCGGSCEEHALFYNNGSSVQFEVTKAGDVNIQEYVTFTKQILAALSLTFKLVGIPFLLFQPYLLNGIAETLRLHYI